MFKNNISTIVAWVAILISLLIAIVDFCLIHDENSKISGYMCNIATELLSISITYFVIQKLLEAQDRNKERLDEKSKILRYNELISIYIFYYKTYFYCLTTPIAKRDFDNTNINADFTIEDMCDLHNISLLTTAPLHKSSIELFYNYEQDLRKIFENFINNNDFKYHENIRQAATNFIKQSLSRNVKDVILANEGPHSWDKSKKEIKKMLTSDYISNHYKKFKENTLGANLATPYFILFELLKAEIYFINEYENLIKDLL